MAPVQEANIDNFEILFFDFLHTDCMLSVLIRIASDEYTQHIIS